MLLDSEIVIRALEHETPKHKDHPRTIECRKLWEALLRTRTTRVLIAAPSIVEIRVGPDAKSLPIVPSIEYVAFTATVAEEMARWATPDVIKEVRTNVGGTRNHVKFDALIVACAKSAHADCVVAYDDGVHALARIAGIACHGPDHFQKRQPRLPHM